MNNSEAIEWIGKYGYFDFTDVKGIMDIGHELFGNIIEKCRKLESRIDKLEKTLETKEAEEKKLRDIVERLAKQKPKQKPKKVIKKITKQKSKTKWK